MGKCYEIVESEETVTPEQKAQLASLHHQQNHANNIRIQCLKNIKTNQKMLDSAIMITEALLERYAEIVAEIERGEI